MTNLISTFETVQLITALNTVNEGEANQEVLLDLGTVEMFLKEEGDYDVYFTNNKVQPHYVTSSNTFSMSGDISRVYDEIIEVINENK